MPAKRKPKLPQVVERKLGNHRADGLCWQDGIIEIDSRLRGCYRLEILCHETLHHMFPDMTEEEVIKHAKTLSRVVWEQNYRRVSP